MIKCLKSHKNNLKIDHGVYFCFLKIVSLLFLKKNFVFICVYAIFFVILHANLRYYAIL